ncbi:FAD-binding oxidoreductase [Rhodopseudomonas infernalis]|uniref:FAD-binding oxidoreductase n=1 Tax=Rhodopseudomonas infernalis TaxID=2897386 RepID=UPI001EE98D6B|nr:FAD-binding oxidoreductase [Rhodopseudomonas infernalis]
MERSDLLPWGRTPRLAMRAARPAFRDELGGLIRTGAADDHGVLAVGMMRSYGDSCLNGDGSVIEMSGLDHLISFDRQTGVIKAEAGVTLDEILRVAIPAGYFLPVTPGTKFVTLGGALANDVHGKNHHHAGTFGRWVRQFTLARTDGSERVVGRDDTSGLFAATIGGLGLTGVITRVTLELMPIASSRIDLQTVPFGKLSEFFSLAAESEPSHDYTVAWIDCLAQGSKLGRGIFTRARHSLDGELRVSDKKGPSIPVEAPGFLLNRLSLAAFNEAYYRIAGRPRATSSCYDPFFYPLDAIGGWNRLYGRLGFYQYQSVVPAAVAEVATTAMLQTIAAAGQGSFLAVLKTFGDVPSPGLLSFPMQGTTLALDFANRGRSTLSLLDKLDAIVREAGGRLYPAKDGRLPPAMFRAGYRALDQFTPHMDPGLSSTFWRRMQL